MVVHRSRSITIENYPTKQKAVVIQTVWQTVTQINKPTTTKRNEDTCVEREHCSKRHPLVFRLIFEKVDSC
jgi:hypothetical protein